MVSQIKILVGWAKWLKLCANQFVYLIVYESIYQSNYLFVYLCIYLFT